MLTHYFGLHHLDLAEDIVQDAMLEAMQQWPVRGIPDNPPGWLMDVAKKKAINVLNRRQLFSRKIAPGLKDPSLQGNDVKEQDGMLAMIFLCCHPALSSQAQMTLALKTLCGLSVVEIADALKMTKANVEKRLYRTKQKFRHETISLGIPEGALLGERLKGVCNTLYVFFSSGYYAPRQKGMIHFDFCFEAMRLLKQVMVKFPQSGMAKALMALMLFTAARQESWKGDGDGFTVLIDQDRSLWDRALIAEGLKYLHESVRSRQLNRFQLMAGISAEHCIADDFASTNWKSILDQYLVLERLDSSTSVQFNKCIAKFFAGFKVNALQELLQLKNNPSLSADPLYFATLGVFYRELSDNDKANGVFVQALRLSRSEEETKLIQSRMDN